MTTLNKDAIDLLKQIPENKLYFINHITESIGEPYGTETAEC